MVNISITKLSSKGQIVIPQEMRSSLQEGERLVLIENEGKIILKKMKDFNKNLEEDLKFAKRTEEAFREYERGNFISKSKKDFISELKKW